MLSIVFALVLNLAHSTFSGGIIGAAHSGGMIGAAHSGGMIGAAHMNSSSGVSGAKKK